MKMSIQQKHLTLNKKTVANLNPLMLSAVRGGATEHACINSRTIDNTISTIDRSHATCPANTILEHTCVCQIPMQLK